MKFFLCCLLAAAPLAAQRDFLTPAEVDQVREAQEPNARLKLYATFAKERVDLIRSLLSKEKAGRSSIVRDTLGDYTKILDAIDDTATEALRRKQDIRDGMRAVSVTEQSMLAILRRWQQTPPKDHELYAFALKEAIDTTRDGIDAAEGDLAERALDIEAADKREAKERRESMTPADREAEDRKSAAEKSKSTEKVPTLMRPGERKPQ